MNISTLGQSSLASRKSSGQAELRFNALYTVRGVDVLDHSELVAGSGSLA
jgi:hypothetical protein